MKKTYRVIDGETRCCIDVGVDDLKQAEYNRYIVAQQLFTTFYTLMENWLTHSPQESFLPAWMPQGSLPQVSKETWNEAI